MTHKQHNKKMEELASKWKADDRITELTEMINKFIKFSVSEAFNEGDIKEVARQKMVLNREASSILKK